MARDISFSGQKNGAASIFAGSPSAYALPQRGRAGPARSILALLRQNGPMARVDLAGALGASAASVSATTAALVDRGILREIADETPRGEVRPLRGRPPVKLDFVPTCAAVVSVRVGLDMVELGLADACGAIESLTRATLALHMLDGDGVIDALGGQIEAFLAAAAVKGHDVRSIAIAFQGFVDADRGVVVWSPVLSCRNVPLAERLSQRLGLPVDLENDAGALALGLARRMPAYASGRTASILVGQGVGLGLLFDGRLYRGVRSGGSEYGHLRIGAHGPQCRCGSRGCIEASLADYALYHHARVALGEPEPKIGEFTEAEMGEIVALGLAGHPRVVGVFAAAAAVLAEGVSILIQLLQPDHVLISGPGVRARGLLEEPLRRHLAAVMVPEILDQTHVAFVDFQPSQIVEGVVHRSLERLDDTLAEAVSG